MAQRDNQQVGEISPGGIYAGAAFFTARSEDEAIDENSPIGSGVLANELLSYSPLNDINIREPWIFRRTWVLGNGFSATPGQTFSRQITAHLPANNLFAYAGGAPSGPFFDSRMKRRVHKDDRLWFVFAVRSYPINEQADGNQNLDTALCTLDYRIYGSMRKAGRQSSF